LLTKLTGMSAGAIGKKALQQVELFFSGMAWYASEHSAWTRHTFSRWANSPETKARSQQLLSYLDETRSFSGSGQPPGSQTK
jgi:hypothetical protein